VAWRVPDHRMRECVHSARTAAEAAVDVVANFVTEDLTQEDRAHLTCYATAIAAERLSRRPSLSELQAAEERSVNAGVITFLDFLLTDNGTTGRRSWIGSHQRQLRGRLTG
jgi:hypothetical protein